MKLTGNNIGSPFQEFIEQVKAKLLGTARVNAAAVLEIEGHLAESKQALLSTGLEEIQAEKVALENFGDARPFIREHNSMVLKRFSRTFSGMFLLLSVSCAATYRFGEFGLRSPLWLGFFALDGLILSAGVAYLASFTRYYNAPLSAFNRSTFVVSASKFLRRSFYFYFTMGILGSATLVAMVATAVKTGSPAPTVWKFFQPVLFLILAWEVRLSTFTYEVSERGFWVSGALTPKEWVRWEQVVSLVPPEIRPAASKLIDGQTTFYIIYNTGLKLRKRRIILEASFRDHFIDLLEANRKLKRG